MRASTLLDTDPAAAAREAGAILAEFPEHDAARLLLGAACRRLGDSGGAIDAIESMARAHPTSALLQLELGRAFAAGGRLGEAGAALDRAVEIDAGLAEAWRELSAQRHDAGDVAAADAAFTRYAQLMPRPSALMDAYAALDANRLGAAWSLARRRLAEAPDDVPTLRLLAAIAAERGDESGAEAALRRVLELTPCDSAAREQLATLLIRTGRVEEALPLIGRLLAAQPGNGALALMHAEALRLVGRHEAGLAMVKALIQARPDDPQFWLVAGNQERFAGNTALAVEAYRHAIELKPDLSEAYWSLSNLKTVGFAAQDLTSMRRHLACAAPVGSDATYLNFALGKALEDRGQYAESFEHYAAGNRSARAAFGYDPAAHTAFIQRLQATFSGGYFAERSGWGSTAADPIFIVGLPRSGSTLLEQILASHSQVEGTRELAEIPVLARELAARAAEGSVPYPECAASFDRTQIEAFAARYLARTRAHRTLGKPRFVDKMLGNFLSVGLIHLMFPGAAIIDSRRHPMATGFSCFKQLFNPGMNFAYDLHELGLYIRDYTGLMAHLDTALPGRVHHVHYEALVEDMEGEVRRLLDYCGLPFEPPCLSYHENGRVAQTVSLEQVRLPIYAHALDQWRHFEPWLGPLRSALSG